MQSFLNRRGRSAHLEVRETRALLSPSQVVSNPMQLVFACKENSLRGLHGIYDDGRTHFAFCLLRFLEVVDQRYKKPLPSRKSLLLTSDTLLPKVPAKAMSNPPELSLDGDLRIVKVTVAE